jgi:hypothetical protein
MRKTSQKVWETSVDILQLGSTKPKFRQSGAKSGEIADFVTIICI